MQIYDFIAVIFPATILFAILRTELPWLPFWQQTYQVGNLAILLVIAYVVGQVLHTLASWLERNKYTKWLFYRKPLQPKDDEVILGGRKSNVVVSAKAGHSILVALSEFYGFPVGARENGLFELIYSPVQDRMAKRDIFLALANMMRSLALVALGYGVFLVLKIAYGWQPITFEHWLLAVSVVAVWAFRMGYLTNKKYSESIPYSAFLAWYQQQKLSKK